MIPPTEEFDVQAEDPRLFQAVQEYQGELESGRRPDRRAFMARFASLAEALLPYLDALDMVHAAAPLLNPLSSNRAAAGDPLALPQAAERMKCSDSSSADLLNAEPLGDFRLLREIGRGGMGVVYEAVQRSLGRRVALKVLPFAAALDARQLQRFKNEAQAAAHLHHSNIVPVYAVGCERGVHFYAMQMIEGQNLASLIESLRQNGKREVGVPPLGGPSAEGPPKGGTPTSPSQTSLGAQLSTQRSQRNGDFFRTVAQLAAQAGRGPGLCPQHGHRPPRRQAGQPAGR